MNIFITGATGLLGQALTHHLLDKGAQVTALVRNPEKAEKLGLIHENLQLLEGDLSDRELLAEGMQGCTHVFHLAALIGVWAPANAFHEVNVQGTRNVMDAALKAGVKRVVKTSTAGIIGPAFNGPVNEETPRKVPFFNEYEKTKAEAKRIAFSYLDKGLEVVIVAPSRVFGPGPLDMSNAATKIIFQYMSGKWYFRPGDGTSKGNYAYLPDLVQGHIAAMEKGRSGEFYLLGGEDLSWNKLFSVLSDIKGKEHSLLPMPMGVLLTFARFQQFIADTFGRPPLITPDWVKRYDYNWEVSSRKAQEELGYKITPFRQAVVETMAMLKEVHI